MTALEIIRLNFSEVRRRSIKLWSGIPEDQFNWKPDEEAFTIIQMIRHVLEAEHLFHTIIQRRGNLGNYPSPWEGKSYSSLENELVLARPYRMNFMEMLANTTPEDLDNVEIVRSEVGQVKKLGDYLNRMAYHESVHTGQMLDYLRTLKIDRPLIWD